MGAGFQLPPDQGPQGFVIGGAIGGKRGHDGRDRAADAGRVAAEPHGWLLFPRQAS